MTRLIIATCLLAVSIPAAAAQSVYAKRDNARIFDKPYASARVLATAEKGEALELVEKEDGFYKVKTGKGVLGYIQRDDASIEKPASDDLGELLGILAGDGKRTASARDRSASHSVRGRTASAREDTASHSIRGLREDQAAGAAVSPEEAKKAVARMEAVEISEEELKAFQTEGKVGRYGK